MNKASDLETLARAYHFAAQKHETQCRKGLRGEPYINHLTEVAELVAIATKGEDANLVAAAVLHDTVEDTSTTEAELLETFGADIASLVLEATDDKSLSKEDRKRLQVEKAAHKTNRAKILKIADKTSNLRSMVYSPPDWPLARKLEYVGWSRAVFAGLNGVNDWLETQFEEAACQAEEKCPRADS